MNISLSELGVPSDVPTTLVGWLVDGDLPVVSTPLVSDDFFERLLEMLEDPWQPLVFAGRHRCVFCRFSGGPTRVSFRGKSADVGCSNLFIPTDGAMFVAPSSIAHYVDAHSYFPGSDFVSAVMQCPPMGSIAYLKLIRRFGLKKIAQGPSR